MAFPLSSDPAVNGSEAIPPFLNAGHKPVSSPSANKELQFITVDSVVLRFDASEAPSSKRELTLTNTSQHRVAWRLRTNAPTRYVVSPANGFLTPTESVVVVVDLADVAKYHKRHRFMVQAMEAKEEEKDHKKIWNSDRASKLAFLQCVRVFTEFVLCNILNFILGFRGSESNTIAGNGLISPVNNSTNPGSTAESSVYTSSTSSGSRFTSSGSTITTSSSSDASSDTSSCSTTSGVSSTSEASAEYNERINDVTQKIRKAMEKKEGVSQNMIKVVNEVKKIEVELDHAGAVCQDLNARLTSIQDQTKGLEQRSAEIEKQLKPMKEGK
ncbi:hypothetical protein QR680_017632 [Steinernema hermaphroditum]|uniref:Major sperm protein n=1 Tax=Steinernema hermaphroditum TaxID=289476 RepID=A0AA39HFA3_9BILA|nr:hypothetical protein QR680_017632 [Steinernema hermaphroditum]